ncbi:MAG: aminomethyl-transferring glycine dehydrogenase subunit GcvPA [Acidimicrobiales bacterium]
MASFTPHTPAEVDAMLGFLGLTSTEELFSTVPAGLRLDRPLDLAAGMSEPDVLARFDFLASANRGAAGDLVCFAGGGAYDHDIPAVVRSLAFRSEFVTAYTPYQAEVAQGVLQALFEYQTMVCRLTGMDVANASLYDGASACVEAVNLAVAATGRSTVWVSRGLNPNWRAVLSTFAAGTGHDLVDVDLADGRTAWPTSAGSGHGDHAPPAALLLACPNYLGCLEEVSEARRMADEVGALLVVAVDPVAMGLLRPPGEMGADIVVGEGQSLGMPLSFGGPYLGLFACRREHVRRLPGRLVGETVDVDGRRAYVTTLRTREQDIRREKASSNVCTNQTLMAVAFLVHLAWLGTAGLRGLALRCARATSYTRDGLLGLDGVEPAATAPFLLEFAVRTPVPGSIVVERMADEGFLAGVPLATADGHGEGLLVAVTERRTRAEIDDYVAAFGKVLR